MTRISYENNIMYIMPEIDRRYSFYYTTPLFSPSALEGKLDYLLGQNYEKNIEGIK